MTYNIMSPQNVTILDRTDSRGNKFIAITFKKEVAEMMQDGIYDVEIGVDAIYFKKADSGRKLTNGKLMLFKKDEYRKLLNHLGYYPLKYNGEKHCYAVHFADCMPYTKERKNKGVNKKIQHAIPSVNKEQDKENMKKDIKESAKTIDVSLYAMPKKAGTVIRLSFLGGIQDIICAPSKNDIVIPKISLDITDKGIFFLPDGGDYVLNTRIDLIAKAKVEALLPHIGGYPLVFDNERKMYAIYFADHVDVDIRRGKKVIVKSALSKPSPATSAPVTDIPKAEAPSAPEVFSKSESVKTITDIDSAARIVLGSLIGKIENESTDKADIKLNIAAISVVAQELLLENSLRTVVNTLLLQVAKEAENKNLATVKAFLLTIKTILSL